MKKLTRTSVAIATAGLFGVGLPSAALATVMATSTVQMTNFVIKNNATGVQMDNANFTGLTFTSTGSYTGNLVGVGSFTDASSAAPVDLDAACVGSGCGALSPLLGPTAAGNLFPHLIAPPVGNYAAADQKENGAPITGLSGFPSPANVASGSFSGLDTQNTLSQSQSTNTLNSSWVFGVNQAVALKFEFDVDAYMQVYVTSDEKFPAFATASYQLDFTIVDLTNNGANVWSFNPDLFGTSSKTTGLNAPLPVDIELTKDELQTAWSSVTPLLQEGRLYQLNARIQTNTEVQRNVPEPASLALVGLGFIGLCLGRRKTKVA